MRLTHKQKEKRKAEKMGYAVARFPYGIVNVILLAFSANIRKNPEEVP